MQSVRRVQTLSGEVNLFVDREGEAAAHRNSHTSTRSVYLRHGSQFRRSVPSVLFLDAYSNLRGRPMISSFVQRRKLGLRDVASWPRSHKAGGRASVSAQVLLTSHFLSREQYKMLLGSKCQMSRTDSCSAGEEGGARGAGDLPSGGL